MLNVFPFISCGYINVLSDRKNITFPTSKYRKCESVLEVVRLLFTIELNSLLFYRSVQASLPSASRTTASVISEKAEMEQFLERYTKERTRQDYRFWIVGFASILQVIYSFNVFFVSKKK